MQLVGVHGPYNWVHIAQTLGSRTPKQCRERYHQNLKPTLNHNPITPEEGAEIERLVQEVGKRWAEIARRLNNRSDNAVKNWWNGNQNRRKRRSREAHDVPSDDHWHHGAAVPSSQTSPATTSTMAPIRASALTLPPPTSSSSNYGYMHSQGHRAHWVEPPLPSPCSSESAESDQTPNYTTSPAHGSLPPPRAVDLPPVRSWVPANPDGHKLPSVSTFAPPSQAIGQAPQLPRPSFPADRSAPVMSRGELPTAPNSPEYYQQQQDQKPAGEAACGPKDPRLSVASLLAPERRLD